MYMHYSAVAKLFYDEIKPIADCMYFLEEMNHLA